MHCLTHTEDILLQSPCMLLFLVHDSISDLDSDKNRAVVQHHFGSTLKILKEQRKKLEIKMSFAKKTPFFAIVLFQRKGKEKEFN